MMIKEDYYIYIKHFEDKFMIISLYVNNILLARNNRKFVIIIKE